MKIKVHVIELADPGEDLVEYYEEREYPDDDRHCLLCVACQSPNYPECRKICPNGDLEDPKP